MYRDVSERLSSLFALNNSFIVFSGASRYVYLEYSGNHTVYSAASNNMKLVSPPSPLLAVPNLV